MELRPSLFCLFFCLLYFVLPPFEDLGCFSGFLMSSAGIQKLFCGIYSMFKCSFDEFVGEKVFSPSYSSAILAPPLLLPLNFPSIRVFSKQSALRIRWPKSWSFSFSISPRNEYSGLISFRIDWFDLLAVQGTHKSLV